MLTVEQSITIYAQRKEYLKLKDAAEASDLANRVSSPVERRDWCMTATRCTSSGGAAVLLVPSLVVYYYGWGMHCVPVLQHAG